MVTLPIEVDTFKLPVTNIDIFKVLITSNSLADARLASTDEILSKALVLKAQLLSVFGGKKCLSPVLSD